MEEIAQTPFGKSLTILTDLYEITMANGYFTNGFEDKIVHFDMFFRRVPDGDDFAIMTGVQQFMGYLQNLSFTPQDLDYLQSTGKFSQVFINYLTDFHFECDVWTIPEGTPIFPGEPIVTVRGPVIQAQFIETMMLLCVSHQALIVTETDQIVRAASGRSMMELGSHRAQGLDGTVYGVRVAYIGGCTGTICITYERGFDIPTMGTTAHSWVQLFDTRLDAFRAYAREYPNRYALLVDTYNVLQSGIPNATHIFNEELVSQGFCLAEIRTDGGDITYLSRKACEVLDAVGFEDCGICASNSLGEHIIRDMLMQGAQVDSFGVGERMITSASEPVFGGVYKLIAVERKDGNVRPKIKISENAVKITVSGFKRLWCLFNRYGGKAIADVIILRDELIDDKMLYIIFNPEYIRKRKRVKNFRAVPLMTQIFKAGQCIIWPRDLHEIRKYCTVQVGTLREEATCFEDPHHYYIDLSQQL